MSAETKPDPPAIDGVYLSSADSTPDAELEDRMDEQMGPGPAPTQTPKRKGGRKPIYATSEERKQRNRQAQAAFRERRTEYIKQLELAIKQHEDSLHSMQQNHRNATDECLMLRYKNSLLERILLEKGIDVQAELQSKGETTVVRPPDAPVFSNNGPTAQRAIMNRHQQAQRHPLALAPKLNTKPDTMQYHHHHTSSTGSSSHIASPVTTFSTPATANPRSAVTSPTFCPAGDFYSSNRLSGQMQSMQPRPAPPQTAFNFDQPSAGSSQPFDYASNGSYQPYEMSSAVPDASQNYHGWMDQSDLSLGKLNPFLSPPI